MKSFGYSLSTGLLIMAGLAVALLPTGCGSDGSLTDTLDTVGGRDISGIAQPGTGTATPVGRVARAQFSTANTAAALAFPNMNSDEAAAFTRGLSLFITPRTAETGLGPVFNQNSCLGCHENTTSAPAATPAARAARTAPTDLFLTADPAVLLPPTATFTLFGDFSPSSGAFIPLSDFGGPIQHVRATGNCKGDVIPSEFEDPNLGGSVDPITGLSALGLRRELGERAGPPYIGRGLVEAIYADDITANEDPSDTSSHSSSLAAPPSECPNDCISGRHNKNIAANAIVGGDFLDRVARFGLRAAGPTLLQFMIGGSQGEVGLTSPFSPNEQTNNQNGGKNCDIAPDPELNADDIFDLRTMIRLVAPPEFDPCLLYASGDTGDLCADGAKRTAIEAGAALFGVNITAFRSRMNPSSTATGDAQGINQADRRLNCVGCHIPIMRTGQSPALTGGRHLSNKWVPLFSDLLLHDMGEIPRSKENPLIPASPVSLEIRRNLADFVLAGQGLASGREWRTPPLMGIGVIGPPFMHDARVFLNTTVPATTVRSSTDGGSNAALTINTVDNALIAVIELHDLPPAAGNCPQALPDPTATPNLNDTCPTASSSNRSEARSVMARWRALTLAEQLQVVEFLKAL